MLRKKYVKIGCFKWVKTTVINRVLTGIVGMGFFCGVMWVDR